MAKITINQPANSKESPAAFIKIPLNILAPGHRGRIKQWFISYIQRFAAARGQNAQGIQKVDTPNRNVEFYILFRST